MVLDAVKKVIRNPYKIFSVISNWRIFHYMPDEMFLKLKYRGTIGHRLNLDSPKTFNEKLQWLKLHDRKPVYTTMVDKYAVKKYVAERIGKQYIIPTLGVWKHFDDIDFDKLPDQFVLKCTHDSGGLVICRDKEKFDIQAARKKITKSLKTNYYYNGREWPYKKVRPRVIAEQYMEDVETQELRDYKFYCFEGVPKFLYLSQGLENHKTARISYVTLDWKQAKFYREDFAPFDDLPEKPINLEVMVDLAKKLSMDTTFLRVDFYEINSKVYFSELTFYPGAGLTPFYPSKWDKKIGELLDISLIK